MQRLCLSIVALHSLSAMGNRPSAEDCDVAQLETPPNPFSNSYLADVYDAEIHSNGAQTKFKGHEDQQRDMFTAVQKFAMSCEGHRILRKLFNEGMTFNHFGMDLTAVYQKRFGLLSHRRGDEFKHDEDVMQILRLYFPTRVSKFVEDVDLPQMFSSYYLDPVATAFGLSSKEVELLRSFQRDGFVLIDEWPLNIDKHTDDADDQLRRHSLLQSSLDAQKHIHTGFALFKEAGFLSKSRTKRHMKSLDPMTEPSSLLMRLSSAYLGAQAEVHDSSAFTLRGDATKLTYQNGPWHVDGCGRRLKAWVYHNDVDEHTHPTVIAAGSHRNHWFPSVEYFVGARGMNKLNDARVQQEFGPHLRKMLGRRGGGFIFDTNAVHGAVMTGAHRTRKTTLIELSTKEHMTLPRSKGSEDGYLSGWVRGLCPCGGDR